MSPPPPPPQAPFVGGDEQYPEEIQVKLYQAFIFSIPILFSIILFLLFYLFYLKRTASLPLLPTNLFPTSTTACDDSDLEMDTNGLCTILYMEEPRRDTMCCVCLGEYREKEELVQVEKCKHVFHSHCIHIWLHNHATCPLCRAPILN